MLAGDPPLAEADIELGDGEIGHLDFLLTVQLLHMAGGLLNQALGGPGDEHGVGQLAGGQEVGVRGVVPNLVDEIAKGLPQGNVWVVDEVAEQIEAGAQTGVGDAGDGQLQVGPLGHQKPPGQLPGDQNPLGLVLHPVVLIGQLGQTVVDHQPELGQNPVFLQNLLDHGQGMARR